MKITRQKLIYLLSFLGVLGLTLLQSCSSNTAPQTSGNNTPVDTTTAASYFSTMSVKVGWGMTVDQTDWSFEIDSAGQPLHYLPGDSLTVTENHNTIRQPEHHGTLDEWSDLLQEIVDSGNYVFTFQRRKGSDTLTALFMLPVTPFDITAPAQGSQVVVGLQNDTIFYTPAGGRDLDIVYGDDFSSEHPVEESNAPDNGKYPITEAALNGIGYNPSYAYLMRRFVGSLAKPAPFKAVNYDYYESSQQLHLRF